jgi:mono-ADP-ribosyltransferase sirtuin 6
MSSSYADRLIQNVHKGKCGDAEQFDDDGTLFSKCVKLAQLIRSSKYVIVHTGAGVSTSAGIPDFRGPNGIWTLEKQGKKADLQSIAFADANPTFTHRAIQKLLDLGIVKHLVTQNVDGLHRRLVREDQVHMISEIHGSAFIEDCESCGFMHVRKDEVQTIGLKYTGNICDRCGGKLKDRLCDWDSDLPAEELWRAEDEHKKADLTIVFGSSLRIRPAGNFPSKTKRVQKKFGKLEKGKIAIINLQKTHLDKECAVRIFGKCDEVMKLVMKELAIELNDDAPDEKKRKFKEI